MSTKLDKWIEEKFSRYIVSDKLTEAIIEYRASRQWVDGPPPEGCDAAFVEIRSQAGKIHPAFRAPSWWLIRDHGLIYVEPDDILRHCPIPAASPLPEPPKPAIPEEAAKNGDGWHRIGLKSGGYVINRVENNEVVLGYGRKGVAEFAELHHVTSWEYLGNIPLEVAEHGDGWYWRDDEIVRVHSNDVFFNGCMTPNSLTNDGCRWEYIPRRRGE